MDLSRLAGGRIADLDLGVLQQMAGFLASSDTQRNWLALLEEMMCLLDSQVVNSLYGMEMRHSAEVAALELLVTLKKMNVGLMDLAKALKKMQNLHALSLLFPPAPPRIVIQPRSYRIKAGTRITLTVEVAGNPLPSLQWFRRKEDGDQWTPVNEACQNNLIIDSLHVLNEGEYCCVACNTRGEVYSEIAEVSLSPKECGPVIVNQLETPQFCVVDGLTSVCLSCKAVAVPPPQYQWYWNDNLLTEGTDGTLDVQIGGVYYCVASNHLGKDRSNKVQVLLVRKEAPAHVKKQGAKYLEEYYQRENLIVTAPSEILAMSPLAQKAYLEALAGGDVPCRRFLLMVVGRDRAGKTSLVKALLGEKVDPSQIEESTSGIDVKLVCCCPVGEKCTFEKFDDLADELKTIKRMQANHIAKKILEKQQASSQVRHMDPSDQLPETIEKDKAKRPAIKLPAESDGQASNFNTYVSTESSGSWQDSKDKATSMDDSSALSVSEQRTSYMSSGQYDSDREWMIAAVNEEGGLSKEMRKLVQEELQKLIDHQTSEDQDDDSPDAMLLNTTCPYLWLRIYDFAGQPLYYNSHACFMADRGIYLIVDNLEADPNKRAGVCVSKAGDNHEIPNEVFCSNLEYMRTWATAVSATCPASLEPTRKMSPVFLMVGTHYDTIRKKYASIGERIQFLVSREELIKQEIGLWPLSLHFRQPFFYIDNTRTYFKDEAEAELNSLHKRICDLAENDEQDDEQKHSSEVSLPYSWLRFEVELHIEAAQSPTPYLTYSEALQKARYCYGNQHLDSNSFTAMLMYYNRLGVLMWFQSEALKDYVIIDPQRVLNLFKQVISLEPHFSKKQTVRDFWKRLRQSGMIEYQDLQCMLDKAVKKENKMLQERSRKLGLEVWPPAEDAKLIEYKEFLFLMLQQFHLLVPYVTKSRDFKSGYGRYSRLLIPSMIAWQPPPHAFSNHPHDAPSILLSSSHHVVPDALYNRVVACCVRHYPVCPQVHRYFTRLHVDTDHDLLLFNLVDDNNHSSGKIRLVMHRLDGKSSLTKPKVCSKALRCVVDAIADVRKQRMEGIRFTLQAEDCEEHDGHFDAPIFSSQCVAHGQTSCAETECIGFIAEHVTIEKEKIKTIKCQHCSGRVIDTFGHLVWFAHWQSEKETNVLPVNTELSLDSAYLSKVDVPVLEVSGNFLQENEQHWKIDLGSSMILRCTLKEKAKYVQYQWFKGGMLLKNENSQDYKIPSFQRENSSMYTCRITSETGEMSYAGPILLQTKPKRDHPLCGPIEAGVGASAHGKPFQHQGSVSLGNSVELRVDFKKNERTERDGLKLQYQWHQNGKPIPNAKNKTLHIRHVEDFHEGIYHCQISEEGMSGDDDSVQHSPKLELNLASPDSNEDLAWKEKAQIWRKKQKSAADKVALLIGNYKYRTMDHLNSPEMDVIVVSGLLQQLGFKVLVYINLGYFEMSQVLRTFYEMIHLGAYALVYFAGHGIEHHNETYMLPIDGDDRQKPIHGFREKAVEYAMQMQEARLSVTLLDCCRVRPRHLSKPRCSLPSLGIGTVITHYSCCSMQPAFEPTPGRGSNSIYATHLIKALEEVVESKSNGKAENHQAVHQLLSKVNEVLSKVNEEVTNAEKGIRNMVWQVPQRRDHVTEHLSLADDIKEDSELAEVNSKIYNDLYSRNTQLSKDIGSIHLELQCGHWAINVLLVGVKAQCASGDTVQLSQEQYLVSNVLEYEIVSCVDSVMVRGELEKRSQHCGNRVLSEQWKSLSLCTHFMKIYNIQRTTSNRLPITLQINGEQRHFNLEFESVSSFTMSSYDHGKKFERCGSSCGCTGNFV